ncbi:PH-like domain-containing protein [Streptomyces fuscigenes]|uniref:PH-like domain-containing protein n=1 Tax=Streptomyces fuscigenes TaxID=1528880 RepID=UPI001F339191|nr:hypothetical protein [Streptomyces fuscigenes]MCF3962186.1 hypothetical protein [Streptomyces fuscigenes]
MTSAHLTTLLPTVPLAGDKHSAPVTDWSGRIGWVVGLVIFIALVYWLMRQGWKWRGSLQSDVPELPALPEHQGAVKLTLSGRYHGSTSAGQWLDRIVAHGLGARSRVELTLTDDGLEVVRPGANDFFVPAARLREARLDKGIAGKVLAEGGLLVVTWEHGGRLLDSGFRSDRSAQHPAWVAAVNALPSAVRAAGGEAARSAAPRTPQTATTEGPAR